MIVGLIGGAAVAWTQRLDLVRSAAIWALERQGFGPARLIVERADLSGLQVRDIELAGGAVRAPTITASYSLLGLVTGRIDAIEVTNARAAVVLDRGRVLVGGRPLPAGTSSDGNSPSGGFRIDSLKLVDIEVVVDGPGGRVAATFSTSLALAGTDLNNASFAVDVVVPFGGAQHRARVVVPRLALSSPEDGSLVLRFERGEIDPKDLPWSLAGIDGELTWRADNATAKIAVGRIASRHEPPLVVPLRLSGTATMAGASVDFEVRADALTDGAKGKFGLNAKGRIDRSSGSGSAAIAPLRVRFATGGLQPADLFPALGNVAANVVGSVALSGSLRWRGDALTSNLDLAIADLAFDSAGARLTRLDSKIKLLGLWPPTTPPGQVLKATIEFGGLPPSNVELVFHVLPKPALAVESVHFDFAGGRISVSPFAVDVGAPHLDAIVDIAGVDLSDIFKLIDMDGLDGAGRLSGRIPIGVAENGIVVREGRLAAGGPGVLRFSGDKVPKDIATAGGAAELALQALADFRYDSLVMELAKDAGGDGTILLRIGGHNPAVLEGHPFQFNIKLESNFDRLTQLAVGSMTAAQEMLRRAARSAR